MKKSITTALCLGLFSCVYAQETLYSQDFEGNNDDIFANGWDVINLYENAPEGGIFSPAASIQAAGFTGKTFGGLTFEIGPSSFPVHVPGTDIAFKTEDYDLPAGNSTISYRVGSIAIGANSSSHYSVYIMASSEFIGIDTEASLKAYLDTKIPADAATISGQSSTITLDLTPYAQQTVSLIFRLHDSPTNALLLFDDIIVKAETLDTPDLNANQFAVYPNPTNHKVTVNASNAFDIDSITITDLNGRAIKNYTFNSLASVELDLDEMASGTYFLGISTEQGTVTKKIIKI